MSIADCFTKRYANFYSWTIVKEKGRQTCEMTLLGRFQYWKCDYSASVWPTTKQLFDKDVKMQLMLKTDIKLKKGDKVEILDSDGEICDTLMVITKPIRHENDCLVWGFNLDVYLTDWDG